MDVKLLREKINKTQQELADETGIPRDRIAKWEQGKGSPKPEDHAILAKYFSEHIREEIPNYGNLINDDFTQKSLLKLIESHKILVESNKTLADSNKELVQNNTSLTKLVISSTVSAPGGRSEADDAKFSDLLEVIAGVGSGKLKWSSMQEAAAELSKRFYGKKEIAT